MKHQSKASLPTLFSRAFHAGAMIVILNVAVGGWAAPGPTNYVSNLDGSNSGGYGISTWSYAESFVTGTNTSGYALNSVSVVMGGRANNAAGFSLSLFSDSGGRPGANLESLFGNNNPTAGLFTYTSSGLALAPSNTYWIVESATTSGYDMYTWCFTYRSSAYTSIEGWSIDTAGYCEAYRNQSWNDWAVMSSSLNGLMQFSVTATAVPEPATIALVALGAVVIIMRSATAGTRPRAF